MLDTIEAVEMLNSIGLSSGCISPDNILFDPVQGNRHTKLYPKVIQATCSKRVLIGAGKWPYYGNNFTRRFEPEDDAKALAVIFIELTLNAAGRTNEFRKAAFEVVDEHCGTTRLILVLVGLLPGLAPVKVLNSFKKTSKDRNH